MVADIDRGRRVHDPVVMLVAVERGVDVPCAQLRECAAFPSFGLAAVLGERDGFGSGGEAVEESAGVDRVQLSRVADEHNFRLGVVGGVEEEGELTGAGHRCFINDERRPRVEGQVPFLELEDA